MRFKEQTNIETRELINKFLNEVVKSLRVNDMDKTELIYISEKMIDWLGDSNQFTTIIGDLFDEIVSNYKRYMPFCFGSIKTAYYKLKG